MNKRPTMIGLTDEVLAGFAADHEPPCLSLYQPTHRRPPQKQQDPIVYRNLLREMEASLSKSYPAAQAKRLMEPFVALAHDTEFWNHTLDGLAVLGCPGSFRALRIPQSVEALVVVADSFHTKPLRRFLQSVDRYQVLGLSLDKIRLFEGNRHALDEVELVAGVPRTIDEALGAEQTGPHEDVPSDEKADDVDAMRFFRAVDRAVQEHYSKPSGLPLILAALPEHHHLFHQVSQNPLLVEQSIGFNPDSLAADVLRSLAWEVIEPRYRARLTALGEEFELARSKSVGSDDLAQVAEASSSGRVETLLIDADRLIAGRLDDATGRVELTDPSDPHGDDLLDDLGELVAGKGGTVLVIPAERMPSDTGLAAIYRY